MGTTNRLTAALVILLVLTGCGKNIDYGSVTDIDGNEYKTVMIGSQEWIAENLRTTKYDDGTPIPLIIDDDEWSTLKTPGYSWCRNEVETCGEKYGALYNWYAVNTGKLCPEGWRVASDDDWELLINFLSLQDYVGKEGRPLKHRMKWQSGSRGTDEYGFSALPGGARYNFTGKFIFVDYNAYWWTASEYSADHAVYRAIYDGRDDVPGDFYNKESGFSVRCIKDTK